MKIFIATYSSNSGGGFQKAFKTKKEASIWLKKLWKKESDSEGGDFPSYEDWASYGAWTAKIRSFNVADFS